MTDEAEPFRDHPDSRRLFTALRAAIDSVGPSTMRIGKSQVGFRRRRVFAAAWRPGQYLAGANPPLVLSLMLRRRIDSLRWKEVVEPYPGRFTHHLELRSPDELDEEIRQWIAAAWAEAG